MYTSNYIESLFPSDSKSDLYKRLSNYAALKISFLSGWKMGRLGWQTVPFSGYSPFTKKL